MKRAVIVAALTIAALCALGAGVLAWAVFTEAGSAVAVRLALRIGLPHGSLSVQRIEGTLSDAFALHGLELREPRGLPKGTVIEVQRLELSVESRNWLRSTADVFNGRLRLPDSEPILFYGEYASGALDVAFYTDVVNLHHLLDMFTDSATVASVQGTIRKLDTHVRGPWRQPTLTGSFQLEKLQRGPFTLADCPGSFDFQARGIGHPGRPLAVEGQLACARGQVTVRNTSLKLEPSRLTFTGDPKEPEIHARATATIGDTDITLAVRGPIDDPELNASSVPPRDPARLLLMLATGQSWERTEEALRSGAVSLGMAREFANYLVFGGTSGPSGFGGVDVHVTYEDEQRGLGASVAVTDDVKVRYDIEQSVASDGADQTLTHRVSATRDIDEDTAVEAEAEREVAPSAAFEEDVWLKLKQRF